MAELPDSLVGLQQALSDGRISVKDALALQRVRFDRAGAALRCISWSASETADEMAAGPLAGIGLAHKDIFDLPGRAPGLGCGPGMPRPGQGQALALQRLRDAGASVLGTLSMAPHACGSTSANEWLGACANPLRDGAVVGGSSSGSAVAVAAGLVYGSLGTDTAGSVRIPAATCGIVGLKPTFGAVPTAGVHPLAPSLDTVGVLARSCADAARLFEIVRGPPRAPQRPVARLRAWVDDPAVHPEIAACLESVSRVQGARLEPFPSGLFECLGSLAEIVLRAESAATHRQSLLDGTADVRLADLGLAGLAMPAQWREAALRARPALLREFVANHLGDDILLMPALGRPIPDASRVTPGSADFDASELLALHRHMPFVNYLGLPAVVAPIATDHRGMPVCAQFVARPHQEGALLSFAERFELDRPGARRTAAPIS